MPSLDGEHEPLVTKIMLDFQVEGHEEQIYITTPCTCGGNCFWSAGAVLYRYDTIGEEVKNGSGSSTVL